MTFVPFPSKANRCVAPSTGQAKTPSTALPTLLLPQCESPFFHPQEKDKTAGPLYPVRLRRRPKYPWRNKLDHYVINKFPVTTASARKKTENNTTLGFTVNVKTNKHWSKQTYTTNLIPSSSSLSLEFLSTSPFPLAQTPYYDSQS
ncbi:hypothetical protein Celaphus_00001907 [Cervus elaphus hippelaphus]|uniref:Uncharacterized protein n=1 Tax=Cervus elaphus hippelaphus TaxID=46360 RepID=A0A212CFD2_CEREH|nr:hypothetical protein Celaphus_00001907 [Cervus elaphus hippelaphus]